MRCRPDSLDRTDHFREASAKPPRALPTLSCSHVLQSRGPTVFVAGFHRPILHWFNWTQQTSAKCREASRSQPFHEFWPREAPRVASLNQKQGFNDGSFQSCPGFWKDLEGSSCPRELGSQEEQRASSAELNKVLAELGGDQLGPPGSPKPQGSRRFFGGSSRDATHFVGGGGGFRSLLGKAGLCLRLFCLVLKYPIPVEFRVM